MRRHGRSGGGSTKVAAAPMSETVSLIHSFDTVTNPNRPARPSPLASSHIQALPLDLVDRLHSFPLFQSTPESFLFEVGQHLRPQLHVANDYILKEGDEAKAMYWLVRGAVAVTSVDGESIHAELKPGAFFGEIGVLMDRPRTATIVARSRCLLVVLTKEDFKKILPRFPEVERAIRDEAKERLTILERKKKKDTIAATCQKSPPGRRGSKRGRDSYSDSMLSLDDSTHGAVGAASKKRKSPSPVLKEATTSSPLANGAVNVRLLLKELPLFSKLPGDILHFLGLNAEPRSYPPFTDIVQQGSQGREVYFIVGGEVEVLSERRDGASFQHLSSAIEVKARLGRGQYFGEVVSLSLAPRRTATVRSVSSVECLMISGDTLTSFWERCPADVRQQVEKTAKERFMSATDDDDVVMAEAQDTVTREFTTDEKEKLQQFSAAATSITASRRRSMPLLTLTETELDTPHNGSPKAEDQSVLEPSDPDPFLNEGLDKVRLRSRRSSLAPIIPEESSGEQQYPSSHEAESVRLQSWAPMSPEGRRKNQQRSFPNGNRGPFPDTVLLNIFLHLELHHLLRLRAVSLHWSELLSKSSHLLRHLDLSQYNRRVTDDVLASIICPFVGQRPYFININNCFHISDEGFSVLVNTCGANTVAWKMKSVWDVSAPAILDMASKAPGLEELDLSNCRKVGDSLLARIVGWVVPIQQRQNVGPIQVGRGIVMRPTMCIPAGTVFGCPRLKKLTLSYCKHITDRSMYHIASHAADRIEEADLTRCTTITDRGFQYWGSTRFTRLRKLCLADCTYLTDHAIVHLTNAAKQLQELDLVKQFGNPLFEKGSFTDNVVSSLVLLLRIIRHGNRGACSSMLTVDYPQHGILRLCNLRSFSTEHWSSSSSFKVPVCARLCPSDWDRGGGDRRRLQSAAIV